MLSIPDTARDALSSLRDVLAAAGYSGDEPTLGRRTRHAELRTAADLIQLEEEFEEPLSLLLAIFRLNAAPRRARVGEQIPALDVDGLEQLGLLRSEGDRVRSLARVHEVDGLYLLSDADTSRPDYVMSTSPSTMLTAVHTPRPRVDAALDVGTGCGVHALLAARHAERVVATDTNPRALWMTELNARLNGIANVETREGDFFAPVEGETFGLVVTNPPYVISPDTSFLYRDAGREGDALCRAMLADLPRYLDDGGFATLQCNWAHARDGAWHAAIVDGLAGSGCDAFALRLMSETPVEYATRWPEHEHAGDPDGYTATVRRWLAHLHANGIESVALAMVVLRRREGARNWRRTATIARMPERMLGEDLVRLFDAQQRELTRDTRLQPAADLTVERRTAPGGEERCAVESQTALGVRRPVSPATADLVLGLDGRGPLGVDPPDELRALVKLGYVTFAD